MNPVPGSTSVISLGLGKDMKFIWETQTKVYIPPNSPVAVGDPLAVAMGSYKVSGNDVTLTFDGGSTTLKGRIGPDPRAAGKYALWIDLEGATLGFEKQ